MIGTGVRQACFGLEGFDVAKKRETFGKTLQRLIDEAGMSSYELARRAGLTRQAISYLMTGDREPTWDTVQRLAKALGLDCSAFEDAGLELPEYTPGKPGRKRKSAEAPADQAETKKPRKGKQK
jgi:transcriptional regulator with XRE-family HTH domain